MNIFEKIGYREKLMGAFSLLTIIIIIILYSLISHNQENLLNDNIRSRIQFYSTILAAASKYNNLENQTENYDFLLTPLEHDEAVKYIQIFDKDGNSLIDKTERNITQDISSEHFQDIKSQTISETRNHVYDLIYPVYKNSTDPIYIQLGLDFTYLEAKFNYNRDYYILIFILALCVAIMLSFFLGNSFDKKVRRLVNYTKSVSEGNLDINLEFESGNEFGKLAAAFNDMVQKLKDSHSKLHSYQMSLEEIISQQNKNLYENEQKYRNLVEASPELILIIQNQRVVFSNNQLSQMFGMETKEIVDQLVDDMEFLAENDRKKLSSALDTISPNDNKVYNFEFTGYHKNKREFSLEFSIHRIKHNQRDAFHVIIRDITERKKFEAELLQLQKMESIGTLAGGVAHDFNNILGIIIPNAEMIKNNSIFSSNIYREADQIESAALKASELTKKLLSLARKDELNIQIINPNQVVENLLNFFSRVIGKNIKIKTELSQSIQNIAVDVNQFEQVLLNIVINAKDAMPDGGELTIKTEKVKNVPAIMNVQNNERNNGYIKIEISDTGIGMDEATQQKIFEPFFTTKKPGHGTGLGLSSVYGFMHNHNGEIKVKSRLKKGTTFTILLPGTIKRPSQKDETVFTLKQGIGLILVIEDEVMMLETLKNLIEHLGFDVITATSGEAGVKLFKQKKEIIKLVIVDMEMPGMNGLDTLQALQKIDPNVKVIISSGYSIEGNVNTAIEKGARSFLRKPYRLKDLSKSINKVISS